MSIVVALGVVPAAHAAPPSAGTITQLAGTEACTSHTGTGGACVDGVLLDYARAVAVAPDGKHVYAVSYTSDAVHVLDRSAGTGALTQTSCVHNTGSGTCTDGTALNGPWDVAVSPDGAYVYVGTSIDDSVVVFARDAGSGALTQVSCVSRTGHGGACLGDPLIDDVRGVTVSPDDAHVYVASARTDLVAGYRRVEPGGALLRVTCVSHTGSGGLCIDGDALDEPRSVAVSADGEHVYAATLRSDALVALSRTPASGTLGLIGCTSNTGSGGACADGVALDGAIGLELSPDGRQVYVASLNSDSISRFDRDPSTGAVTQIDCTSQTGSGGSCADGDGLDGANDVAATPDGVNVYASAQNSDALVAFTRDTASGALTQHSCVSETGAGTCVDGVALNGALGVGVAPDGLSVYGAAYLSDAVSAFGREVAPICAPIAGTTTAGVPVALAITCTDANNDPLALSTLSSPLNGSLGPLDQATGSVTYSPNAAFVGSDAFTFTASDGTNVAATQTASLDVAASPPPAASQPADGPPGVGADSAADEPPAPRIAVKVLNRPLLPTRHVRVRVACKGVGATCSGRVLIRTQARLPRALTGTDGKRRVLLARRAFFLASGEKRTLRIRLSRRSARVLASDAGGRVRVVVKARNELGGRAKVVRVAAL